MVDFDLYIYNDFTNEPIIIHNFGFIHQSEEVEKNFLYIYTKDFIQKQIPFRVEFVFNK